MDKGMGYMIKTINERLKNKADEDFREYNITFSQSRILVFLREHDNEVTQKEIETFLEVSHPTVSGIVSRMEQNGFVTCRMDHRNRRNKIVRLTEKALIIGEKIDEKIQIQEKRLIRNFTGEEIQELERMLMAVYDNI